jgi:hypothetical protein
MNQAIRSAAMWWTLRGVRVATAVFLAFVARAEPR